MKYLFFDVECSNCFNGEGKLCEFGYVITDENFCVLRKDVLPMSPGQGGENRFDKGINKESQDLNGLMILMSIFNLKSILLFMRKLKAF